MLEHIVGRLGLVHFLQKLQRRCRFLCLLNVFSLQILLNGLVGLISCYQSLYRPLVLLVQLYSLRFVKSFLIHVIITANVLHDVIRERILHL